MTVQNQESHVLVNCRIGSLENFDLLPKQTTVVNCRIGSLENR